MSGIKLRIAEPEAITTPGGGGIAAEDSGLTLLRQIALAGGTVSPKAEPYAPFGYAYAALGDDVEPELEALARRDYLEARFFDRVSLCPKCNSHHLNVREICPGCRKANVAKEGLLHHFRCGYVGIPSEFVSAGDGGFVCPKCNRKMHHIGTEYDRLGRAFACRGCGLISETPPVEAVCFACHQHTPAEDLISAQVFGYILTSRGAAAVRRGSLLEAEDEAAAIADAAVLRKTVTRAFLDHEMKRLEQFDSRFSVLLAKYVPKSADQIGDSAAAPWLARLRPCLRDVDVIGQLADALYVVILPQTRRRAAEALCHRIEAALGPKSPLTLTIAEISQPQHLAPILAGLDARGAPS